MMQVNIGGLHPGTAWSYSNLHGDEVVTADNTGTRSAGHASYDPFGQPIDPATGSIGTTTADDAVPDTSNGNQADNGWVGSHQKLYEHLGTVATVEMGARQYVAALGRFLSVDPVAGGNSNAYNYPNDPINGFDLSGRWSWGDTFAVVGMVLLAAAAIVLTATLVGSVGDVPIAVAEAGLGAEIAADVAVDGAVEVAADGAEGAVEESATFARSSYARLSSSTRSSVPKENPNCSYCGKPADTIDHIKSLKSDWESGGSRDDFQVRSARINNPKNLNSACRACNSSKAARDIGVGPGQWRPQLWGLRRF